MQDYNGTLNLPVTDFPMRANLPQREPEMLQQFLEAGIYEQMMEKNEGKPLYILHDGPPYANGNIHIGHALNKILKDFIVRYRNMAGYKAPYVPGWDTHGLPIELKAREKAGKQKAADMSPVQLRKFCREYAEQSIDIQRQQFKRLGIIGEWDNPYITMDAAYEAEQIRVFGEMAMKGYIYKGLKPVYWCPDCQTALAEAEIEYEEDRCYSVYVKFQVKDDKGLLSAKGIPVDNTYFVIWTTTTWTLPGNVAICLGPDFSYHALACQTEQGEQYYIMADGLYEDALKVAGITDYRIVATFTGAELEMMTTYHPFLDRESLIIVGDHVTLESGTGCVHTAPGHGVEDFDICQQYEGLPVVVPVDNTGRMTAEAGDICAGMTTDEASKAIAKHLHEIGALLATEKIVHQYPHCWRCKDPVLFRATEQWFCSVEDFKDKTVETIKGVSWIPTWGEERITSMVRERNDWCISRQRLWGVPIPIFYCADCDKAIIEKACIEAVAELFEKEGSDGWYTHEADEIVPKGTVCPHCGGQHFRKEQDIMDVWFDSGSSHRAVLKARPYLKWPADLYLEGSDQYRGWFQSSLLTAVACHGQAPYKQVLSHGWTVDGEGKKMSKSLGNGIEPEDVVSQYGADILRLWVASLDYKVDARLSKDILKQLSEAYRKIRNTARFILGNISDFNPATDMVAFEELEEIDRWALIRLDQLVTHVNRAYQCYEFHDVFHGVHNFCVVDMSNFYLDVLKDRLYVEKADSATRRKAQSVIYQVLDTLTRLLAPVLAFTTEEIWRYLPHSSQDDSRSVLLNQMPKGGRFADDDLMARWKRIHDLRDEVQKALETARKSKVIGSSLDAKVTLTCGGQELGFIRTIQEQLPAILIVSQLEIVEGSDDGVSVEVAHADGDKCSRCWSYGHVDNTSGLCDRCAGILSK